ncbi:MAG: hypothetical protein O7B25_11690, partial [Gammaproteobacteria bacterium]|nr:hypothetical protein [Gammaproteobacteria bacterium]
MSQQPVQRARHWKFGFLAESAFGPVGLLAELVAGRVEQLRIFQLIGVGFAQRKLAEPIGDALRLLIEVIALVGEHIGNAQQQIGKSGQLIARGFVPNNKVLIPVNQSELSRKILPYVEKFISANENDLILFFV